MGRKKRQQADNRADLRGGGFIGLPQVVHKSKAYRSLSVFERAVLLEIIAAFNGYNNGTIVISQRQIAKALENSNYAKIGRSIAVLMERGLLDIETEGLWKKRRAREYRLTFISSGKAPYTRPATNEYLMWRAQNDADDASAVGAASADTVSADTRTAVATASSARSKKSRISVGAVAGHC